MTFCDEHDGGCGSSLTATDYQAGFCTQCKRQLTTKETRAINYTQSDRERAIHLILAEVGKGYTIDEAVKRLTSNDSERDSEQATITSKGERDHELPHQI